MSYTAIESVGPIWRCYTVENERESVSKSPSSKPHSACSIITFGRISFSFVSWSLHRTGIIQKYEYVSVHFISVSQHPIVTLAW